MLNVRHLHCPQRTIFSECSLAKGIATYLTAQFENFAQIVDTEDNESFILEISGDIKSDCMQQWATVETIVPIEYEGTDCPSAGEIQITIGDETTTVTFASDGAVTVGDKSYGSCRELDESCDG